MSNLFDLTGKVAFITGASSGLGADAAIAYAQAGADIVLAARRKDKLEGIAGQIRSMGRKALAVGCDVGSEQEIKVAVEQAIAEFGKIDILINNAGIAALGTVETMSVEDWNKSVSVNLTGIYLLCKYVVPHMKKAKYGKIVNVSSINAVVADKSPMLARHVYNSTKAAVNGLTLGMAATYMQDNITVNSVGPGLFESEMTEDTLFKNDQFLNMYNALTPAGRPAKRGELNGTLIYLSSDASSYVTGQYIVVDGGFTLV